MFTESYKKGFINVCNKYGLSNDYAQNFYKSAARVPIGNAARVLRGFRGLGKPLKDILGGTFSGTKNVFSKIDDIVELLKKPLNINKSVTKFLSKPKIKKIPGLRSFSRGYVNAQREFERHPTILKNLAAITGLGKGSLTGNTLAGIGSFTQAHPLIGTTAISLPVAALTARILRNDSTKGLVDTMTPSEMRSFNRIFNNSGYSGLREQENDLDIFGEL